MKFEVSYITNTGLKREHNEDSILVGDLLVSSQSMDNAEKIVLDEETFLCVVADGMGGHAKGEVASQFVLERLKSRKNEMHDAESIKDILFSINEEMIEFAEEHSQYLNMGTVLAGVFIKGHKLIVFNVGDCRVYENNFGYANLITNDHTLVYSMYERGEITIDEILTHPKKNIVTSAFVANRMQPLHSLYIKEIDLPLDNKIDLLICSDGLWESMAQDTLEKCFQKEDILECLKNMTIIGGAKDNFSGIYMSGGER